MPDGFFPLMSVVDYDEKPWGDANPLRGVNHRETATMFLQRFPIGSKHTSELFDEWAQGHGFLNVPIGVPTDSDAWIAHVVRRQELRKEIISASTHPGMGTPFTVKKGGDGKWVVLAPHEGVAQNDLGKKLVSLLSTKRTQLDHLMQCTDWDNLQPFEKAFAESIYSDIRLLQSQVTTHVEYLETKFENLGRKLKAMFPNKDLLSLPSDDDLESS